MDDERDPPQLEEHRCPGCGEELAEEVASWPVCQRCDERFDVELVAYLSFVAVARE